MDVRSLVFLILLVLLAVPDSRSETAAETRGQEIRPEPAASPPAAPAPPDPYKDITWETVLKKNEVPKTRNDVVVYQPDSRGGDADVVLTSSTNSGGSSGTTVAVGASSGRRSKHWFFG